MSKDKNIESFKQKGAVKAFVCGLGKEISEKTKDFTREVKDMWNEDRGMLMMGTKVSAGLLAFGTAMVTSQMGQETLTNNIGAAGVLLIGAGLADGLSTCINDKTIFQNAVNAPKNINNFVHKMVDKGRG